MKRFVAMLISCLAFLNGSGDVLLWQVDENTKVDDGDIQLFLVPYPSDNDHFPAARVKLVSSDGSSSTILKIWGKDEDGVDGWLDGDWGAEVADWYGGYGARDNHSETGFNTIQRIQDAMQGITPDYSQEVMDALFIMELGYNEWNDDAGDYVWRTLAESAPELYRELVGRHMYASGDVAPPTMVPWSPDFRSVPEPSTSLLGIIGLGLLLLKRKTNG